MNTIWRVLEGRCDDGALIIEDSDGITVCELAFTGGDEEYVARLIASAPKLLAACKTGHLEVEGKEGERYETVLWIEAGKLERSPR